MAHEYLYSRGPCESPEPAITGATMKRLAGVPEHHRLFLLADCAADDREIGDDEIIRLDGAPILVYDRPPV